MYVKSTTKAEWIDRQMDSWLCTSSQPRRQSAQIDRWIVGSVRHRYIYIYIYIEREREREREIEIEIDR